MRVSTIFPLALFTTLGLGCAESPDVDPDLDPPTADDLGGGKADGSSISKQEAIARITTLLPAMAYAGTSYSGAPCRVETSLVASIPYFSVTVGRDDELFPYSGQQAVVGGNTRDLHIDETTTRSSSQVVLRITETGANDADGPYRRYGKLTIELDRHRAPVRVRSSATTYRAGGQRYQSFTCYGVVPD